jgi:hypothetical protein
MACSVRKNTVDLLEKNGYVEVTGEDLIRKRSAVDVMSESRRLSLLFNKSYGTTDIPFMPVQDKVIMNDALFDRIDDYLAERGVDVVDQEFVEETRNEIIASMRAVMRQLGVS